MMYKLAANVVWSINASRSTLEQARKIWDFVSILGLAYFECVCREP